MTSATARHPVLLGMATMRGQASELRRSDGRQIRVLVVDDEPALSELLLMALSDEGWEVRTAADGGSTVRAAREIRPDVMVLDLRLPDLEGLEVLLRRLRAETPEVPVLFLTARDAAEDRIAGLAAGADDRATWDQLSDGGVWPARYQPAAYQLNQRRAEEDGAAVAVRGERAEHLADAR